MIICKLRNQIRKRRNALVGTIIVAIIFAVFVSFLEKIVIRNDSKKDAKATLVEEVSLTGGIAKKLENADLNNIENIVQKATKVANIPINVKLSPESVLEEDETPTEVSTEVVPKSYTEEDFYWLSHIIMAEVGDGTYENKILCGLVVMNRVKDPSFHGETIEEVIFSPGQYETTWNGRIDMEPNEECLRAAEEILSGTVQIQIPPDVVYQAQFKQGSDVYKEIDGEIYCYK